MPFTLSHAMAVLPGLRQGRDGMVRGRGPLIASALVAGSFAPDAPYFADSLVHGVFRHGETTHGALGVVLADPLIAAGLAGGWFVMRGPLTALLPHRWQGPVGTVLGCDGSVRPTVRTAAWFWASATAGAATHVGWDAFTHHGRWGVRLLPFLDQDVHGWPLHKWAQYGSSAVGLAVLGVCAVRAVRAVPREAPPPRRVPRLSRRARRAAVAGLAAGAAAGAALRCRWWWHAHPGAPLADVVPTSLFGAGAGLPVAALAYALLVRATSGRQSPGDQWAADSQSGPTPTETSSGARKG
jgi:hypothetical protein